MTVTAIMATCGRHHLAERSLRFFLDQLHDPDKETKDIFYLLIYNNSDVELEINPSLLEGDYGYKGVKLVDQHISTRTGESYNNLGDIYNDALKHIPDDTDIVVHWDDDDIFLPNHLYEGVRGMRKAKSLEFNVLLHNQTTKEEKMVEVNYKAYKPSKSYYRHPRGIELMSNTLEPSIFVDFSHLLEYGYSHSTTDQHLQWVNPLVYGKNIFVDDNGKPTLIYNWGDTDIPTFKTSGNAGHPNNFSNYRNFSKDHGDRILTPWPKAEVQKYYDLV